MAAAKRTPGNDVLAAKTRPSRSVIAGYSAHATDNWITSCGAAQPPRHSHHDRVLAKSRGLQAVLVNNNAYAMSDIAGLGHRARLDAGTLGIIVITVNSAIRAVELLGWA
jgi:hypothetical protein